MCYLKDLFVINILLLMTSSLAFRENDSIIVWKSMTESLPTSSLKAGFEDSDMFDFREEIIDLYICKVGDQIGKFNIKYRKCYIAENGQEVSRTQFQILTTNHADNLVWVPVEKRQFPSNLIKINETSFIGRQKFRNLFLIPGNVLNNNIKVTYDKRVYTFSKFEVLTEIPKNIDLLQNQTSQLYNTERKMFAFKVRSEKQVVLHFGIGDELKYSVTIGDTFCGIGPLRNPLFYYKETNYILNSRTFKGFWIRWTTPNYLELGIEDSSQPLLTFSDESINQINSVAFVSPFGKSFWKIANLSEKKKEFSLSKVIQLPANKSSNIFKMEERYFPFQVNSDKQVFLDFGFEDKLKYRLTISNLYSGIGTLENPWNSKKFTFDILMTTRFFWVRWAKENCLEFGAGDSQEPLLRFVDENVNKIDSVVLSSSDEKSEWKIMDLKEILKLEEKETLKLELKKIPAQIIYEKKNFSKTLELPPNTSSRTYKFNGQLFTFKVRTENEAFIDLGVKDDFKYRVVIGNTLSGVGPISNPFYSYKKTLNILENSNMFGIKWGPENSIEFGADSNDEALLTFLDDNVRNIDSIRVSSSRESSEWEFVNMTERQRTINLPPMKSSRHFLIEGSYFPFKVKSEKHVFVDFGIDDKLKYRVTIGNVFCGIGTLKNPLNSLMPTKNILNSSNFTSFWIKWDSGNILKLGTESNDEPFLTFSDENIDKIDLVLLSSSERSEWQIYDLFEKRKTLPKDPTEIHLGPWKESFAYNLKSKSFRFEVKSDTDVYFDLEVQNRPHYRVNIGNSQYGISFIDNPQKHYEINEKIDEKFSFKIFVVNIVNNTMKLIDGETDEILVQFTDSKVGRISSVIFASTLEESTWTFMEGF